MIQSLRKICWDNGNDSFGQSIGYTVDLFMNTGTLAIGGLPIVLPVLLGVQFLTLLYAGYICYLYIFNMWILYNVSDPFEILGSVIIFEFLFDLDEEIAQTGWWDEGHRFLKAGVVGNILQNTIRREYTATRDVYLEKLGTTLSAEEKAETVMRFDAVGLPKDSDFLSGVEDASEIRLLTIEERIHNLRYAESKASFPDDDDLYEEKPEVYFSRFSGPWDCAIFERHQFLRKWSSWEKL